MSIGSVVTRGFSTGGTFQPGVKFLPTRGFLAGPAVIPPVIVDPPSIVYEPVPGSAGATNSAREYWTRFRADEDLVLMAAIKEFLRNL